MGYRSFVHSLWDAHVTLLKLLCFVIVRWIPMIRTICWEQENGSSGLCDTYLHPHDWVHTLGGWQHVLSTVKRVKKELVAGGITLINFVPRDIKLTHLTTREECYMHTGDAPLLKEERPLVLYFGSCTSPAFVKQLSRYVDIMNRYSQSVDFAVVYVREFHACDEWAIKNNKYNAINQPQNILERMDSARRLFAEDLPCPILVDGINDSAAVAFGCLPERVIVIHKYKLAYRSKYRAACKDTFDTLEEWIEQHSNEKYE